MPLSTPACVATCMVPAPAGASSVSRRPVTDGNVTFGDATSASPSRRAQDGVRRSGRRSSVPLLRSSGQTFDPGAIPLGRLAEPGEIGWPVAFLCSRAASFMTGAVMDVNGGSVFS